jgi:hypothetical protein
VRRVAAGDVKWEPDPCRGAHATAHPNAERLVDGLDRRYAGTPQGPAAGARDQLPCLVGRCPDESSGAERHVPARWRPFTAAARWRLFTAAVTTNARRRVRWRPCRCTVPRSCPLGVVPSVCSSGMPRALVTGASGYIGRRLVHEFEALAEPVGCVARDPRRVAFGPGVTVHRADLLDPGSLSAIGDGYRTAYYLVHSMGRGGNANYEERDANAASNFARFAMAPSTIQCRTCLFDVPC